MYQLSSLAGQGQHVTQIWPLVLLIAVFLFVTPVSYFFTHGDTKRRS